ncbi:MAG TPA: DHHA1 domain-containing protein [Vicinamibacterales bacterium]|nr:DHHA1 domain-containing protein [Vicinamibacterales bacterium]
MTTRLYYDDSTITEFDATVTGVRDHEGRPAVTLDRTAFYPTSGGQPFDAGTLGDAAVVDVIDDEDTGEILHVVARAIAEGSAVRGTVDRVRRLDHMQQHTGQHILSAAFEKLHHARTVSFHLGAEASTIDLDREVNAAAVAAAERLANDVVWDDRPIGIRYASEDEAALLPLRKEPKRTGRLRLIEVPGCDLSACGGTHVPRTGVIGMIAVSGVERFKGGLRVSFVCGGRALARFARMRTAMEDSIKRISVHPDELPVAIGRLQDEIKAQRQTIRAQQEKLAASEAEALRGGAEIANGIALVVAYVAGWDSNGLKLLASTLTSGPGVVAALVGDGSPAPVVIARSEDARIDAGEVLRGLLTELGGKGGGKPGMAQGAVSAEAAPVRAEMRTRLLAALA